MSSINGGRDLGMKRNVTGGVLAGTKRRNIRKKMIKINIGAGSSRQPSNLGDQTYSNDSYLSPKLDNAGL